MDAAAIIQTTQVEPRPYQARIVGKAVSLFQDQKLRSVLIDSPTGSGKTVMGLLIARILQERLGLRIGWVAMRRYLLDQAAAENAARAIHADLHFISMFDKEPPRHLDMLIVDEAQHDAASSMAHLHNLIQPRCILGLSATPFRADKVKLCFDAVIKDAGIHALIQDGWLSPFHHYTLPKYTPAAVVDCYRREPGRWGKSLMYFHTLAQCFQAAALLKKQGIACDVVTGGSDRDAQLAGFRAGRTDVLLNCMVLAEGFDCPELRTVFCRPSCKSVTVQMCGRVLRKHPRVPVKQIVQCGQTRWPFTKTAGALVQFTSLNGSWRSLNVNPQIDQISGRVMLALAKIQVELPAFLLRRGVRSTRAEYWRDAV